MQITHTAQVVSKTEVPLGFCFSQIQVKVHLESHRGRKSKPAGLCGLRKQITEAKKKGPWSLGKSKGLSLKELEGGLV